MSENVKVSFYVPEQMEQEIDHLVQEGLFTTKTDLYQEALRRLLLDYRDLDVPGKSRGNQN
jgi:Arc/MetJ-type ribon-helix-helix transcriptional regulator